MYWEAQKCLDGGGTVKKVLRLCTRTVCAGPVKQFGCEENHKWNIVQTP